MTEFYATQDEIWQPSIEFYNRVHPNDKPIRESLSLLKSSGTVFRRAPARIQMFCDMDFYRWPFDEQQCVLSLYTLPQESSWLIQASIPFRNSLKQNNAWRLVSNENNLVLAPHADPVDYKYSSLVYKFNLARRSSMYHAAITVPAVVIIALALGTFCVPVQSCERFFLNGFVAAMLMLFLVYFAQRAQQMAVRPPLIGKQSRRRLKSICRFSRAFLQLCFIVTHCTWCAFQL